jgi:hypothetical protein
MVNEIKKRKKKKHEDTDGKWFGLSRWGSALLEISSFAYRIASYGSDTRIGFYHNVRMDMIYDAMISNSLTRSTPGVQAF